MSGRINKTYKSTIIILLVLASLFVSTIPAYANTPDYDTISNKYEQGGTWANVLRPFAYYPNAEITLPDTAVPAPVIETVSKVQEELAAFASNITTGRENVVVGVYAEDVMAYPVVQQPSGSAAFVSEKNDVVTQFALASQQGSVGILAHNFLAGASFFDLTVGQDLYLVYGDGKTEHYVIKELRSFQALQPYSPYSEFIDLETNARYSSGSLFYEVYGSSNTVVLQTCIAAEGVDSWGRLFVIAELVY